MKRLIFIVLLFISTFAFSQDFTSRAPGNSFSIIYYSGKTITNSIPISRLDKLGLIKNYFFEALHIDATNSLAETGIDFSSNLLQYAVLRDTVLGFVTLFSISNSEKFIHLVDANYGAELRPLKRNGYEIVYLSNNSTIAWNGKNGVFVYGSFLGGESYRPYMYSSADSIASSSAASDSVTSLLPGITEHDSIGTPPVIKDEEAPVDTTIVINEIGGNDDEYLQWERRQDSVAKLRVRYFAENISLAQFKLEYATVSDLPGYSRVIDSNAAVSVWMSTNNLFQVYWAYIFNKTFYPYKDGINIPESPADSGDGLCTGTNIYFEKDRIHSKSSTYTRTGDLKKQMKALYKQRRDKSISGFINPESLGYVSFSFNTEAAIHSYYDQMKRYLSYYEYTKNYSDIINLYIDLMEIIIDEKGISDLFPGNYLMVLHGISSKQVKYTDYEYDSNFEYKTIQKVKDEPSPDFSFVMDTKRADFVQKALEVPLKYAKKNNFNYQKIGDYYELKFPEGESFLSSLYFMISEGRFVVTTNKDVIDKVMHGRPFDPGKETQQAISNNVFAAHFDLSGILTALIPQIKDESGKKVITYLSENIKSADAFTGYKKGELKGEVNIELGNNFENSLLGIFEMIERVNQINREAKQDAENKLN